MGKTVTILLIALFVGCIGHVFLRIGMKAIAESTGEFSFSEPKMWGPFFFRVLTSSWVVLGVGLQAFFFALWLVALSRAELSFVLPFSAMEYLFAAFIAYYFMAEDVSWMRISGTAVVCLGVGMICLDQLQKNPSAKVM